MLWLEIPLGTITGISNETYRMSECTFAYVCLKESYKNNLALSWTFQGEAEGFLIYDADSGKAAGYQRGKLRYCCRIYLIVRFCHVFYGFRRLLRRVRRDTKMIFLNYALA